LAENGDNFVKNSCNDKLKISATKKKIIEISIENCNRQRQSGKLWIKR
jgi:hypothetical protein